MKIVVVIPVGPGHEELSKNALRSVMEAWAYDRGVFTVLKVARVLDLDGHFGRSVSRNKGLDENQADWYFLLDADDRMWRGAFLLVDLTASATFGAVCLDGKIPKSNRWPVTREDILQHGAEGTLSMGCFVRGDVVVRFDEQLNVGEDFDFYLRLPGFTKRREALVDIGYRQPSAGGPRSSAGCDWWAECEKVVARYRRAVQ